MHNRIGSCPKCQRRCYNLVSRFYDATGGRITIDGIDVRDVTIASLRNNVGIAQQDIFLFSTTIRDNIAYGAVNANTEQIEAAAKAAHLHDFIQSLPDGYDTWVGERGLTLSGGEKQRLAIARTLLINPGSPTFPQYNHVIGSVGFLDIKDGQVEARIVQLEGVLKDSGTSGIPGITN